MSWKKVRLSELCNMSSGGTPSRAIKEYFNGEIPWAKISDIESAEGGIIMGTEEHITVSGLASINNRIFPQGTLLLAMYGSVGKAAFTGIEMSTNQAILGIRIKDENVLNYSFLKYWFQTIKEQLLNRAVGGTLQNISLGIVKDLEIPLPPLPIQKRIAEILDAADALRRKDQELLKKYDELAQAIFIDMFGDPVKNEKGWKIKTIGESIDFMTSGSRGWAQYYAEKGDLFLRINNVGYNEMKLNDLMYVTAPNNAESIRTEVKPGDILLSITADLGRTCVIPVGFSKAFISQHLAIIRLKKEYEPNFVSQVLSTEYGKLQFKKLNKGGVKAGLNFDDIKSVEFINPPIDIQKRYKMLLTELRKQFEINNLRSQKSNLLFDSLIQQAFKGELVK
ncbi:MAG: restriction endonuclease subunit S [Paludibacter sp.]